MQMTLDRSGLWFSNEGELVDEDGYKELDRACEDSLTLL